MLISHRAEETLPPKDEIILAGHSLGGYLVADAALASQTNPILKNRIIAFIAFDTPYLGRCVSLPSEIANYY